MVSNSALGYDQGEQNEHITGPVTLGHQDGAGRLGPPAVKRQRKQSSRNVKTIDLYKLYI